MILHTIIVILTMNCFFSSSDIILTVVWLLLMVIGIVFQLYRERTKAPFPPCPRKVNRRYLQPLTRHLRQTSDDNDDRQSLVPDTTPHYNQYVAENVHIPEEPCSTWYPHQDELWTNKYMYIHFLIQYHLYILSYNLVKWKIP